MIVLSVITLSGFNYKCKMLNKLFYKGESNSGWNRDKYGCSFPALISEWRRVWSENSPTDSSFPFGFVQLAAYRANYAGSEFPVIRWHQTADVGYVPNDAMPV
jgi:sialate O-acetylesterase